LRGDIQRAIDMEEYTTCVIKLREAYIRHLLEKPLEVDISGTIPDDDPRNGQHDESNDKGKRFL